ncbi:hypothetical protein DSM25558_0587 [Agrobacterium sp. DSM 25558]|uniref:hypothetical protein n=1 Tax=Agrobacterium sp. DSM 25558 TaxID=1907665 RepID=UPI0009725DF4|nr:hypothetical protein [Agrobacterium sp. DSM 25558]SCX03946.1 hypothetical protein DSM25558_0587 [Agrobacterium sp. DSM 25558]
MRNIRKIQRVIVYTLLVLPVTFNVSSGQERSAMPLNLLLIDAQNEQSMYYAYVKAIGLGIAEANQNIADRGDNPIFCTQITKPKIKYTTIVTDYVQRNPALLTVDSTKLAETMILALQEKFPCAK